MENVLQKPEKFFRVFYIYKGTFFAVKENTITTLSLSKSRERVCKKGGIS